MNPKPLNTTSRIALVLIVAASVASIALVIRFWLGQPEGSHLPWQASVSPILGPGGPSAAVGYLHGHWVPFGVFMGGVIPGILLHVFSLRQPRP